jgi:hypothetical protein
LFHFSLFLFSFSLFLFILLQIKNRAIVILMIFTDFNTSDVGQ